MIKHFEPRPAVIRAIHWSGKLDDYDEVRKFAGKSVAGLRNTPHGLAVVLDTNNGEVNLYPDHWVIEGATDFYPCDPETMQRRWQEINGGEASRHKVQFKEDGTFTVMHPLVERSNPKSLFDCSITSAVQFSWDGEPTGTFFCYEDVDGRLVLQEKVQ